MHYQRVAIKLICNYHMIRSSFSIIKKFQGQEIYFLFKGGWSLLIKRSSIKLTLKSLLFLANMRKIVKIRWIIAKQMMFFQGRFVILCNAFSNKSRNSKILPHSGFKMPLNFAILSERKCFQKGNEDRHHQKWI